MSTAQKPAAGAPTAAKRKSKKNVPLGKCHIESGFGNTIITFTDPNGGTLAWSSGGLMGFKGSRKGTPFAAQVTAEDASKKAIEHGLRTVSVLVRGPGAGREPAVRAIAASGIKITSIRDITPIPHNGCRPPKRRRV